MKPMRVWRSAKYIVAGVAAAALLGALGLYLQASRTPGAYAPAELTPQEKDQAAREFLRRVQEFGNAAQQDAPFTWSVSEERVNAWLASMDEIAARMPHGRAGQVYRAMEKVGFSQPAVTLRDGKLTLMVLAREYGKVVAVDFSLALDAAGRLRVTLGEVRVGRLSVPKALFADRLGRLRAMLAPAADIARDPSAKADRPASTAVAGLSSDDLAGVLAKLLAAVDGEPIEPVLVWPINKRPVRVREVGLTQGTAVLTLVPIPRDR